MSDTRDFDPRFDPAFQRGYVEGASTGPRPVRRPVVPAVPPEPLPANAPDARVAEVAEPLAHPEPAVSLAGNPWIRALWIIAPVFILGGLAGQAWAQSRMFGSFNSNGPDVFTSYIIPAVTQAISPWMVLVGLAALVGVVFLHAVRWRAEE